MKVKQLPAEQSCSQIKTLTFVIPLVNYLLENPPIFLIR